MRYLSIFLIYISFFVSYSFGDKTDNFSEIFRAISNKNWKLAESLASGSGSVALKKIILSQKYLDASCKDSSFEKVTAFLSENPGWHAELLLKNRAESHINSNTNKKLIYKWFLKHKPVSGNGYKNYAYAAYEFEKDPNIIIDIIKNGWKFGDFCTQENEEYYNKFKKYLSIEDHIVKIDRYLFFKNTKKAKELFKYITTPYRKSFEAQIAFIEKKKGAIDSYKKVPSKFHTAGLASQFIEHQKKLMPHPNEIVNALKGVEHDSNYGDIISLNLAYIAREYLEKKKYSSAYKVISAHFAKSAENRSNAEFFSGWLALRYLNKPKLANIHFKRFDKIVKSPISKARGKYWLGRTSAALGNKENAKKYYLEASNYPYTFYGQTALIELGKNISLPDESGYSKYSNEKYVKQHDIYEATLLAVKYGGRGMAQSYINAAVNYADDPKNIWAFAHEFQKRVKDVHYRVWFAKKAANKGVFIKNINFPTPYNTKNLPTEDALTYSIIKQESVFDQFAVSSADAKGLMQLINSTACNTAKKINTQCHVANLTRHPDYNIKLGTNHLNKLINDYSGSYILAIASYNAGPHRTNRWIKLFEDPRKIRSHYEVIDWIELIPFYETRNYVQRVLENLQIYRILLNNDRKLELKKDLMHIKKVTNE